MPLLTWQICSVSPSLHSFMFILAFFPSCPSTQIQECTAGSVPCPPAASFLFLSHWNKTGSYIRMTWCMSGVTYPLPLQWRSWDVNQEAKVLLPIARGQLYLLLYLFDSRVSHLQGGAVIQQLFHPVQRTSWRVGGPGQGSGEQIYHQEESSVHYRGSESWPS